MKIYNHFLDAISKPKCIRITDNLWALRFESMKLASCDAAVQSLLSRGIIDGDTTLVDSSSGIYGYALALTCHKYDLKCHIIASTTVDESLLLQLKTLGASVDQVPPSVSLKYDQRLRVQRVQEFLKQNDSAYWMQQYHDRLHYEGYRQLGQKIGRLVSQESLLTSINLVAPVGSGASSAGLYSGINESRANVRLIGIQPFGSVSFGAGELQDPDILVAGIGSAIPFGNIEYSLFDEIHWITAEVARHGAIRLLANTGIFGGLSSGLAYTVGKYLSDSETASLTLFLCPDMGYRYADALIAGNALSRQIDEPVRIEGLDELTPPWCAMEWGGKQFVVSD